MSFKTKYFNIEKNSAENNPKGKKYRVFKAGGEHEDKDPTYALVVRKKDGSFVANIGVGIKSTTPNGNIAREVEFSVKDDEGDGYTNFRGTLYESKNKKTPSAPDLFGNATTKADQYKAKYQLSAWAEKDGAQLVDKDGVQYLSASIQAPYVKVDKPVAADAAPAASSSDKDLPF